MIMDLNLVVRPINEEILSDLEGRNLIRRFRPSERVMNVAPGTIEVDRVYETDPKFGSHMLICVGFNKSTIELAYHSDQEDFLLVNEGRDQKPLILVIALKPEKEFQKLISNRELTTDELLALELKFNDPCLSFFTMNSFTPHCEWTVPGPDPGNVFYVTEPNQLDYQPILMGDYSISITYAAEAEG
jgi:hypothetical protein